MSVVSNITAVVDALITAINARNAPGASDYQMWLAQGNTGTLADYRTAMIGSDVDYAAQFNSQLGALPTSGNATESYAGVTQFATLAEALTGTTATKALSALQASATRIASSLSDLNTKAPSLPVGSIIALPSFDTGGGNYVARSIWYSNGGTLQPLLPVICTTVAALNSLYGSVGSGKTYANLNFDPFVTTAIVSGSSPRDEYMYVGTTSGFILWRGGFSLTNGSKYQFDSRANYGRVDGLMIELSFSVACSSGNSVARDDTLIIAANYSASNTVFFTGASASGGSWAPQSFWVGGANINVLSGPVQTTSGTVLSGNTRYLRTIPTS